MRSFPFLWVVLLLTLSIAVVSCGDDDDDNNDDAADDDALDDDAVDDDTDDDDTIDDDTGDDDTGDDDTIDDDTIDDDTGDDDTEPGEYWKPSDVVPIGEHPMIRNQQVLRGIIHLHSVYSHDACDSRPFINGEPNERCLTQLRTAMCSTNQQYIMLTDHDDPFSYYEFPDVLLYMEDEGDELILNEEEEPIANIITCEDGNTVFLTAGNENDLMPISLDRMPDGTPQERMALLGAKDEAAVQGMRALGATVFVNHAEQWTYEELAALPIEGIEVYNLHANIDPSIRRDYLGLPYLGFVWPLLNFLLPASESGHSDLILLTFLAENTPSLENWDRLLADRRMVGLIATDAHRNSLPFPLWDGDRADSYRRMMRWFANYILVDDYDLPDIEEAIAGGRMYGAFQVFGEPIGFDFYAETGKAVYEMGDEVALTASPIIHVTLPELYRIDPTWDTPEMTIRLIRAGAEGGTVVAEETDQDLTYTVTQAGAYRVEVSIVPGHLEPVLGNNADWFIHEYPLIYANPIYVND
ncbi:MAG TPA: hypothetical protein PKW95_19090 [bacterium]|nr:hypothetical protein [bacterium]